MDYEREIEELKQRIAVLERTINIGESKNVPIKAENLRDKTRYMFNNKIYPKNRLVFAVVSEYVKQKNPSYIELKSIFDKSLQGSLNVVEELEEAKKIKDCAKRYFIQNDQQLKLKDGKIAVVCTQWGIFNIPKFIKLAQTLGYIIESI